MPHTSRSLRWSFLVFPLAGFASALFTVCVSGTILGHANALSRLDRILWAVLGRANLFGSLTFGFLIGSCFWVFFGLRSISKAVLFALVSVIAAFLSLGSGLLFVGSLGDDPRFLPELCIGGYVGAFVILLAASLLVPSKPRLLHSLLKSLYWALAGGILAGTAILAAPEFHGLRMRLDPGVNDQDISLFLVWQTGMALILAVLLWTERKNLWDGAAETPTVGKD